MILSVRIYPVVVPSVVRLLLSNRLINPLETYTTGQIRTGAFKWHPLAAVRSLHSVVSHLFSVCLHPFEFTPFSDDSFLAYNSKTLHAMDSRQELRCSAQQQEQFGIHNVMFSINNNKFSFLILVIFQLLQKASEITPAYYIS